MVEHGKQVGGIEAPQQRRVELGIAPVGMDLEMQARLRQLQLFPHHSAPLEPIAGNTRGPGLPARHSDFLRAVARERSYALSSRRPKSSSMLTTTHSSPGQLNSRALASA